MMSMRMRVKEMSITTTAKYLGDVREHNAIFNSYKVVLRSGGKQYTFRMTTGLAIGEPDTAEALDCLVSDASAYWEADDFRDFADNFGWDIDESEDEKERCRKVYNACEKTYNNLKRVFGSDGIKALMFETERM